MNKNILVVILILILGISGFLFFSDKGQDVNTEDLVSAIIHKDPNCGCCGVYGTYMDRKGYDVTINNVDDILAVKDNFEIPEELESCHTTEIDGYVVEGHVPNEAIQKLLTERPDIKGIGMAGMPAGSPGMPGPKTGEFVIHEITHEGEVGGVFMQI